MQLALQSQAWSQVSRYFLKVHRKVVGSSYEFFVSALKPRRWNCRDKENKLIPCLLSLFSVLLNCLNFKITVMHRLIKCHNILLSRDRKLWRSFYEKTVSGSNHCWDLRDLVCEQAIRGLELSVFHSHSSNSK